MANTITGAAKEIEINGVTYGTRYMDPEKVLMHAGKIFNLSAAALMSASASNSGLMDVLNDCFDLAMADGKEMGRKAWKVYFLGKPKELVQVIAWMLEVHFADFFGEAVSVGKGLKQRFGELLGSEETTPQ